MSKTKKRNGTRFTRREFVRTTGTTVAAAGVAPAIISGCGDDGGTTVDSASRLRILQRNHFVPAYDRWLDEFATSWGQRQGIEVEITRVADGELLPTANAAFENGEGFDLVEFISAPSAREEDVLPLNELNEELNQQFGQQLDLAKQSSYNPQSQIYYGCCVGWTPLPNLYRRSLWRDHAGMENGPTTWEELRDGGAMVKSMAPDGNYVALGMSPELDSSQSMRALLWSFGGMIQNENNEIALDSDNTRAALTYAQELVAQAMDTSSERGDIFNWTASSNNQALISGDASLVSNPISAYRTPLLQGDQIADDIFLTPALPSAMGDAKTPPCCLSVYVVPTFSEAPSLAQDFLRELVSRYGEAVQAAALYNLPAWEQTAPMVSTWLQDDPQGSSPPDKLAVLADAGDWTVNLGWPGSSNPAVGEIWDNHILPGMFAAVAQGGDVDQAITDTVADIEPIFERWRSFL